MNLEQIAQVAHQANKACCDAFGDNSQVDWDDAPEWQKDSARLGALVHTKKPNLVVSHGHDLWMKDKIERGWVYGKEMNPNSDPPTHPCLVEFNELPKEQQLKDYVFQAVVHAMNKLED